MTSTEVSRFVTLALDDEHVRTALEQDADAAFQGFDLTGQEKEAISAGDEGALRQMGLDPMTARSWAAFHTVAGFAPDRPDLPNDVPVT
jgi:hypothetical protein